MNREDGFYWVKYSGRFVVAQWVQAWQVWRLTMYGNNFIDEDFDFIGERLLPPT